jgi:hypothetical protein
MFTILIQKEVNGNKLHANTSKITILSQLLAGKMMDLNLQLAIYVEVLTFMMPA